MAAVILPFALAIGRQVRAPAQDPAPRVQGAMTLDLDGGLSPLRGPLPAATGSFVPGASAPPRRRVPADAILAIGRGIRRAASLPEAAPAPAAARPRMPRKHKLMLVTAAAVLYLGGTEARRHFKPRAVLIEVPDTRAHAIAALPPRRPAA
ncbi:hypothetical protein [Methylobacterium frigidaeris]|uniref:Uncharacterized protein n=1 Tax=Methylobacterium frigidaeris TaxID=2038277 RepID=A0AA37H8W1_9HYPH|nr:hypothetical protein [Methylobacterium frigidaeris]PIK70151.1 hypothetical protein CS379_26175 [Methylobacterium frigidaeris]GJD61501.1 hypothetical protein MPEAHAMD_1644 [Methylobacterium frigidaeris]